MKLTLPTNLHLAYSTTKEGVMSFVYQTVLAERKQFLAKHGMKLDSSVSMRLEHDTNIADVSTKDLGANMESLEEKLMVDALVTTEYGITLMSLTADCLPIVLYDKATHTIALVHCSWKNTSEKFVRKVLKHLHDKYHVDPSEVQAIIGPSIRQESYGFEDLNQKNDSVWQPFLKQKSGKYHIDVVGYNVAQMVDSGVLDKNIQDCGIDTYTNTSYFSHRRSQEKGDSEGRMATVVMMTK
jgi:YfiH family protein